MNMIAAQGSPGSLTRHFQEHPQDGVRLLRVLMAIQASWNPPTHSAACMLSDAIASVNVSWVTNANNA